jgi:hypothetical protein
VSGFAEILEAALRDSSEPLGGAAAAQERASWSAFESAAAVSSHPDRAGGSHDAFLHAQDLLEEALAGVHDATAASQRALAARMGSVAKDTCRRFVVA